MRPFLFQYGYKNQVQFVQESAFVLEALLGAWALNNKIDDKVSDALQARQYCSLLQNIFTDLDIVLSAKLSISSW